MNMEEEIEEDLFEVECFLSTRKKDGKRYYKVRWKGFPPEEDTWEPEENVEECTEVLEAFWAKQKRGRKQKKKCYTMVDDDPKPSTSIAPTSPVPHENLHNLGLTRQATKELQKARMKQSDVPESTTSSRDLREYSSEYQSSESDAYDLGENNSCKNQDMEPIEVMSQSSSSDFEVSYHNKKSKKVVINLLSDSDSDCTRDDSDNSLGKQPGSSQKRSSSQSYGLPPMKSPEISRRRPVNVGVTIPSKSPMLSQYNTSGDEPMGLVQEFEDTVLQSPEFQASRLTNEDFELPEIEFPELAQNIYSELPSENESADERLSETTKTRHSTTTLGLASQALAELSKKVAAAEAQQLVINSKSSSDTYKEENLKGSVKSKAAEKEFSSLCHIPNTTNDAIPSFQPDLKSPIFERPTILQEEVTTPTKSVPTTAPPQTLENTQASTQDFEISPKRQQRFNLSLKKKNRRKRYEYLENSSESVKQQESDSENCNQSAQKLKSDLENTKEETKPDQTHAFKLESLREKMAELEKSETTCKDDEALLVDVPDADVDKFVDLSKVSSSLTELKDIMYKIADEKDNAEIVVSCTNGATPSLTQITQSRLSQTPVDVTQSTQPHQESNTNSATDSLRSPSSSVIATSDNFSVTHSLSLSQSAISTGQGSVAQLLHTSCESDVKSSSKEKEKVTSESSEQSPLQSKLYVISSNNSEIENIEKNFEEVTLGKKVNGKTNIDGPKQSSTGEDTDKTGLASGGINDNLQERTTETDKTNIVSIVLKNDSEMVDIHEEHETIKTCQTIEIPIQNKNDKSAMDTEANALSKSDTKCHYQVALSLGEVVDNAKVRLNEDQLENTCEEENQTIKSDSAELTGASTADIPAGQYSANAINDEAYIRKSTDAGISDFNQSCQTGHSTDGEDTIKGIDKVTNEMSQNNEPQITQAEEPQQQTDRLVTVEMKQTNNVQLKSTAETTQHSDEQKVSLVSHLCTDDLNQTRHAQRQVIKCHTHQVEGPSTFTESDQEMENKNQTSIAQEKTSLTSTSETSQQTNKAEIIPGKSNQILEKLKNFAAKIRRQPSLSRSTSVVSNESSDGKTKDKDLGKSINRSISVPALNESSEDKKKENENLKIGNNSNSVASQKPNVNRNKKSEYVKFFGLENVVSSNESSDDGNRDDDSVKKDGPSNLLFSKESSKDEKSDQSLRKIVTEKDKNEGNLSNMKIPSNTASIIRETTSRKGEINQNKLADDANMDYSSAEETNLGKANDKRDSSRTAVEHLVSGTDVDSDDLTKPSIRQSKSQNSDATSNSNEKKKPNNIPKEKKLTSTNVTSKRKASSQMTKNQKSMVSSDEIIDRQNDNASEKMDLSENEGNSQVKNSFAKRSQDAQNDEQDKIQKKDESAVQSNTKATGTIALKKKQTSVNKEDGKVVASKEKIVKKTFKEKKKDGEIVKDGGNKNYEKNDEKDDGREVKESENENIDKKDEKNEDNDDGNENKSEHHENISSQISQEKNDVIDILDSSRENTCGKSNEKVKDSSTKQTTSHELNNSKKTLNRKKQNQIKKRRLKSSSPLAITKKQKLNDFIDSDDNNSDAATTSNKPNEKKNSLQRTNSNKQNNETQNSLKLGLNNKNASDISIVDDSTPSLVSGDLLGTILDEEELSRVDVNGIEATNDHKTADSVTDSDAMDVDDNSDLEIELEDFPLENLLDEDVSELREIPSPPTTPMESTYVDVKQAIRDGDEESVRAALAGGLELNVLDGASGMTLLMMASSACQDNVVELLLRRRADVNATQKNGMTALMHACEQGCPETAHVLLMCGADINKQLVTGETALMKACKKRHTDVVEVLLKHGADTRIETKSGQTAATVPGASEEILSLLEEHEKRLTKAIEQAISTCLGDGISVCKPPVFPYRCISPNEAQHFNFPFHYTTPKQTTVKQDVILFCIKGNFTDDMMSLTFGEDNGVRGVVVNGKTQVPLLHGIRSIFSIEPKKGSNKITVQTHKCAPTTKLIVCIYTIEPS